MKIFNLPIIDSDNESDFRKIFQNIYLSNQFFIEGYFIKIFPEDFNHICYEYDVGGQYKKKFSLRRARKLLAIKEICQGNIPYILIHQENRDNKSVCILCKSIELSLFLVPKKSLRGNYFTIGTIIAYGKKVEEKMEKQKKSGKIIKSIREVFNKGC